MSNPLKIGGFGIFVRRTLSAIPFFQQLAHPISVY